MIPRDERERNERGREGGREGERERERVNLLEELHLTVSEVYLPQGFPDHSAFAYSDVHKDNHNH